MGWIRKHRRHLYPGCLSEIRWPLTCLQCSNFNTREEIEAFLSDPTRPFVVKNSRIYSQFSVAEIEWGCGFNVPVVSSDGAGGWATCYTRHIFGSNFGAAQGASGRVYLGNAGVRDDVTIEVDQGVTGWSDTHISIHVDLGALDGQPGGWIYVQRDQPLIKPNCVGLYVSFLVP